MIVGIPGTGIGGLFYLVNALALPVRGVVRKLRGRPVRLASTLRQAGLAVGTLAGLWLTGELLGRFVLQPVLEAFGPHALPPPGPFGSSNVLRLAPLLMGLGTLAVVLGVVRVTRIFVRRAPRAPGSAAR